MTRPRPVFVMNPRRLTRALFDEDAPARLRRAAEILTAPPFAHPEDLAARTGTRVW